LLDLTRDGDDKRPAALGHDQIQWEGSTVDPSHWLGSDDTLGLTSLENIRAQGSIRMLS
jgi:hypothetical protein